MQKIQFSSLKIVGVDPINKNENLCIPRTSRFSLSYKNVRIKSDIFMGFTPYVGLHGNIYSVINIFYQTESALLSLIIFQTILLGRRCYIHFLRPPIQSLFEGI